MNCIQARELVPSVLYGKLEPETAKRLDGHLQTCPDCLREYQALKQLQQMLDAAPTPDVHVDLPQIFRQAAERQEGRMRRWRRAAIGIFAAAAAVLIIAVSLRLEVRVEEHQAIVRWGSPPVLHEPVQIPNQTKSPEPSPLPADIQERLRVQNELIHALHRDIEDRDRKQQQRIARLSTALDELGRQTAQHWRDTEQNIGGLFAGFNVLAKKGEKQ